MSQQFCLKWNNHMNNMMDVFKNLLSTEAMVDVTLACDGLSLKAHKIVLSACSPFFQSLFLENPCKHPIVILKDMKYTELKAIIEFMYHGEVNVAQDQLSALMKTAETLRVKGLAEVTNEKNQSSSNDESSHRSVPRTDTPPPKRRRGRTRKRSMSDRSDDEASEPKIKQPDSPEIEELSGDMDNTQYSTASTVPTHSTNSFHKQSQQEQPVDQGADESFAPEEKFGVEPSKLLEQTLTTDDLPRRSGRSSVQSNMELQRRPRSSTDHSSNLVPVTPTSMPSDALVVANQQPESPPDIKPELLDLEPPMSPVAGPSHSTDENSMMMYMDQSSMSAMPGPSGYQDNSALVSTDSQPQDSFYPCFVAVQYINVEDLRHVSNTSLPVRANDGDIDLRALLQSTVEGRLLLTAYSAQKKLTDEDRSILADILIGHELSTDTSKGFSKERIEQLTKLIIDTFPTEQEMNWVYMECSDEFVLEGKFIRRYNTWKHVTKCVPVENAVNNILDHIITEKLDDGEISRLEVSVAFLRFATKPWSIVEDLWKKTMEIRHKRYFPLIKDGHHYFKSFPCLKEPLGLTLLEKDFKFLYPHANYNLFAEWPKFSSFLEDYLKRKDKKCFEGACTPESRMVKILMNLSQIFPASGIIKEDAGVWRFTRAESQASFFLLLKSIQDLQPILQQRNAKLKKFGLCLQPLLVGVGSAEEIKKVFIVFDDAMYDVDNPLKGIDCTFKLLHALHMPYPLESNQIWFFLQQAVYDIYTDNEKMLPQTSGFVMKYKTCQSSINALK